MKCPICGSNGEDLVFKFYCNNPTCQNADSAKNTQALETEIKNLILHMWQIYNIGETIKEFTDKFFSGGGSIYFDSDDKDFMCPLIVEPEWLKERMRRII